MRTKTITVLLILIPLLSNAQLKDSSLNVFNVKLNYSAHIPGGDIAKRFGLNSMIGPSVELKHKSNWTFGVQFSYVFGSNVKQDDIFQNLQDNNGGIINEYGEYGTILLTERGFYLGGHAGKIIPVLNSNPNSGIKLELGAGLLEHHIHIENKDNNVPSVIDDYRKGYDRRTNGLSVREFIGYQYLDPKGYFNFYAGFEFYQAWTYNRRDLNFDTGERVTEQKQDFLSGLRIGWILPLYRKAPDDFYYY